MTLTLVDHVGRAHDLARVCHAGQSWGEFPYTEHMRRIIALLPSHPEWGDLTNDEQTICYIMAWLHDSVEDTGMTLDVLAALRFPAPAVLGIGLLTHEPGIPNRRYWAGLWPNRLARIVKDTDVAVNSDEEMLRRIAQPRQDRLRAKYVDYRTFREEVMSGYGLA